MRSIIRAPTPSIWRPSCGRSAIRRASTIVRLLADGGELYCTEIQERLDMPVSTCSYHLRLLREAGITHARASGTVRYVSLRGDDLAARFPGLLDALEADAPATAAIPAQLEQ